jgi:LysR family glycine cleavage system transcriptional activator
MRRRLPPLNALRAFEAAARNGGFAAAAVELGVTAGAVSRHVQLLEARLKRRLFDRGPRSLSLTADGRALLPVLEEAFDGLEANLARALAPAQRAVLALNVQTSFAIGWMLPRLKHFHRAQPEIELRLSTQIDTPDLRNGTTLDAAIIHGRGPWEELTTHFLFADRLVPVCAPAWLAARTALDPHALAAETLLVSETAPADWEEWFTHAGLRGLRPARPQYFASSLLPAQAALHGVGVALADQILVASALEDGRLVNPVPHVAPLLRGTGWHLAHAPARGQEPAIAALRAWLVREAGTG